MTYEWRLTALFVASAVLFTLCTVFIQVGNLSLHYLSTEQLARHRSIVEGSARAPYQYRILSDYAVEGLIRGFAGAGIPQSMISGFISFRLIQNLAIFVLFWKYLERLGFDVHT